MASIYRAMDDRLDRIVCVKLLRLVLEGSGSSSGRSVYQATYSHFLQEALALSRLQHPNTLRIYDFGYLAESGRPFQISEFLDGGNLETHVKARGPLSRQETGAVLERITGAVMEAHQQKIIHRDIKPSNILFGRVGDMLMPKLADFGIAHSDLRKRTRPPGDTTVHDEHTDAVSTVTLFSPRWAAPEQLAGSVQGAVTDVYALGLVTVYMLAGRPVFEGSEVRGTFADRIRGNELISRTLRDFGFGADLGQILLRAMDAMPDKRYPTPLAFFEAIRTHLAPTPEVGAAIAAPAPAPSPAVAAAPGSPTVHPPSSPRPGSPPHAPPPSARGGAAVRPISPAAAARVRVIDVHEKLDLTFQGAQGEVRLRVTLIPSPSQSFRINVKGLNCFVKGPGGRPTPAIVASADGSADFISTTWKELGHVGWSFGMVRDPSAAGGRVFRVEDGEMMVPFSQATQCVALYLGQGPHRDGRDGDVVIMCRRG